MSAPICRWLKERLGVEVADGGDMDVASELAAWAALSTSVASAASIERPDHRLSTPKPLRRHPHFVVRHPVPTETTALC